MYRNNRQHYFFQSQPAAVAAMALPQGVFQQQLQALAAQGYTLLPTSKFMHVLLNW